MAAVQIIPQQPLTTVQAKAAARIGKRDPAWPAPAVALECDCPAWGEDEDFFGSSVATWTMTVEIVLGGD